eukprot:2253838-Pyramimonas_sp.AAC.2
MATFTASSHCLVVAGWKVRLVGFARPLLIFGALCMTRQDTLAQKNKALEVSRESMLWRDNLYSTKLEKAEGAMHEMQQQE